MNYKNTPIVVVAYNRPRSLERLLGSLKKAIFLKNNIDLIISIDKATNNEDVLEIANNFIWDYGTKKVNYQAKNLGLKTHILQCGNISQEYGSVIVLEDDLYVAQNFYKYTTEALEFSQDKKKIGGISLYNHQLNVNTFSNFQALDDGFDNWYFQFASSWGQAWTKTQWSEFISWYKEKPDITQNFNIPAYIRSWSKKSWLKYNISYLIENNLYFLYPKISLSTNFSDAGTHVGQDSTMYQVPLDLSKNKNYKFSNLNESNAIYDSYFENTKISKELNLQSEELSVDLYGYKNNFDTKYLLSSQILNFKIMESYGRSLKPIDANIIEKIQGEEFFLYNTQIKETNSFSYDDKRRLLYNFKYIKSKDVSYIVKIELRRKIQKIYDILFKW